MATPGAIQTRLAPTSNLRSWAHLEGRDRSPNPGKDTKSAPPPSHPGHLGQIQTLVRIGRSQHPQQLHEVSPHKEADEAEARHHENGLKKPAATSRQKSTQPRKRKQIDQNTKPNVHFSATPLLPRGFHRRGRFRVRG